MVTDTIYAAWYSLTSVLLFFAVAICIRGMARMLDSLFKIICVSDVCQALKLQWSLIVTGSLHGAMGVALLYRVSHCVRTGKCRGLGLAGLPCCRRVLLYPTSL